MFSSYSFKRPCHKSTVSKLENENFIIHSLFFSKAMNSKNYLTVVYFIKVSWPVQCAPMNTFNLSQCVRLEGSFWFKKGGEFDLGPSSSTSLLMARLEHASLMKWDHCHFFFIPLFSLSLFVTFLLAYANENLIFVETKS